MKPGDGDEKKRKAAELNAKELKARQEAQEKSDRLRNRASPGRCHITTET